MHPWGTDQTWDWDGPLLDDGATMMTRCVQYEPCQDLYLKALADVQAKLPSLALTNMVDKIWTKISPSVASDPRKPYSYGDSEWSKNSTKNFINNRYQGLVSYNGLRQRSSLAVSYSQTGLKMMGTIRPKVTRTGNGTVTFTRIEGNNVCQVDSATGLVTILNSGLCRVGIQIAKTDSFHGAMTTAKFTVPKLASRINVAQYQSVRNGSSITFSTVTDSTGSVSVKLKSGRCRVSGKTVKALASSGRCIVSVSVAGDSNYLKATKYYSVTLRK